MDSLLSSYWKIFRLNFVIFSLYLIGDVIYRWAGARFYMTFFEFIPSVALVTILWSIVALLISLPVWLFVKSLEWFCQQIRLKVNIDNLLILVGIFVLLVISFWSFKRLIPDFAYRLPHYLQRYVFIGSFIISMLVTWLFRVKPDIILERITPLMWIFGIWTILSLPIVAYQTLGKQTENYVYQRPSVLSESSKSRPNILLITYDALTARNMSLYGYDRPTTPFINEWAKKTSVFNRVEAEGNWTATTVPSLMTGKRVWTHRVFNPHGSWVVKGSTENFPLLMKDNGYYTAAYNANSFASPKNLGLFNSFDNYYPHSFFGKKKDFFGIIDNTLHELFAGKIKLYNWFTQSDFIFKKFIVRYIFAFAPIKKEGKSTTTVPTDIAYNQFLQDLDKLPEPFFVWIHHYPPHDPYLPPEPYMGMFDASLELRTDESQENVVNEAIKNIHEGYQNRSDEFQQNINRLRARYDEFIRYCDNGFQDFISKFELKNKINKTVIIISADHGESFDHFNVKHGGTNLFESVTNIPLIIKKPDQSKGQLINNLTEQIDIPATILSLASIPVPAWMEGRSLTPLLDGKSLSSKPAISMSTYKNNNRGPITNGVFAVWEDDYKLILTLGDTDSKHSLLFNLKQDPDEMHNLFDKKTEIGLHLLNFINREFTKSNERNRKGKQL